MPYPHRRLQIPTFSELNSNELRKGAGDCGRICIVARNSHSEIYLTSTQKHLEFNKTLASLMHHLSHQTSLVVLKLAKSHLTYL